jgi:hypothetical protein
MRPGCFLGAEHQPIRSGSGKNSGLTRAPFTRSGDSSSSDKLKFAPRYADRDMVRLCDRQSRKSAREMLASSHPREGLSTRPDQPVGPRTAGAEKDVHRGIDGDVDRDSEGQDSVQYRPGLRRRAESEPMSWRRCPSRLRSARTTFQMARDDGLRTDGDGDGRRETGYQYLATSPVAVARRLARSP